MLLVCTLVVAFIFGVIVYFWQAPMAPEHFSVAAGNMLDVSKMVDAHQKSLYDSGNKFTSRVAIVSLDDRPQLPYVKAQQECLTMYARKWPKHYSLQFEIPAVAKNVPPYWAKVFAVRDEMQRQIRFNSSPAVNSSLAVNSSPALVVMWIDSDAVLLSSAPDLRCIFDSYPDKDIFVVDEICLRHVLCAGVFAVRCTPVGLAFIDAWIDRYKTVAAHRWSRKSPTGKWECKNCMWAGDQYEQGQLIKLISDRSGDFFKKTLLIPWDLMNYNPLHDLEAQSQDVSKRAPITSPFLWHLYGKSPADRTKLMNRIRDEWKK